jgi:hypothetical protein
MEAKNFICFNCKHFSDDAPGCAAFTDGIPEEITSGDDKHTKPLKGQENALVFERAANGL